MAKLSQNNENGQKKKKYKWRDRELQSEMFEIRQSVLFRFFSTQTDAILNTYHEIINLYAKMVNFSNSNVYVCWDMVFVYVKLYHNACLGAHTHTHTLANAINQIQVIFAGKCNIFAHLCSPTQSFVIKNDCRRHYSSCGNSRAHQNPRYGR